jgi:hypothetical protein
MRFFGEDYYLFILEDLEDWVEVTVPTNSNPLMYWDRSFSEQWSSKISGGFFYEVGSDGELVWDNETIKLIDKNANEIGAEYKWNIVQAYHGNNSKKLSVRSSDGSYYIIDSDGEITPDLD